jgi:putative flippase GtrA
MNIAFRYALFALMATGANILTQDLILQNPVVTASLGIAVCAGTAAGLVVKYILDKRYIFRYRTNNAAHDGRTFLLYSLMGVVTTVIFWTFEFSFQRLFQTRELTYLGGVIGLAIGYVAKYFLDKHYVFRKEPTS